MGMRPLVTSKVALVLENRHVLESAILLQVSDPSGPDPQNPLDLLIAKLRHTLVMVGSFHNHFVRSQRAHLVVHAFGQAAWFPLDAVEGIGMRKHAHLPRALRRPGEYCGLLFHDAAVEGARLGGIV